MVAPTSRPRFSNTSTYSISGRASSASVRSAQRSITRRTWSTGRLASDSPGFGEKSTPSEAPAAGWETGPASSSSTGAPGASAGQRFGNHRTSYGSGASNPPIQNGQSSLGRFGRAWRCPTTFTHSPVSVSRRSSPDGASPASDPDPLVTTPYSQFRRATRSLERAGELASPYLRHEPRDGCAAAPAARDPQDGHRRLPGDRAS